MSPGQPPLLPRDGSVIEFSTLYLDTVTLYKECEIKRKTLSDYIRNL